MQVDLAEFEYYEENWEAIESDDGHIELYID
jgi:predicted transcriptional regulator YdeE